MSKTNTKQQIIMTLVLKLRETTFFLLKTENSNRYISIRSVNGSIQLNTINLDIQIQSEHESTNINDCFLFCIEYQTGFCTNRTIRSVYIALISCKKVLFVVVIIISTLQLFIQNMCLTFI